MLADPNYQNTASRLKAFGKYSGSVTNSTDPLGGGRVEVLVPDVHGDKAVWALPCVPYAEPNLGFFMIPPVDALVWIEFAGGDRNKAIWSGCYWKDQQAPSKDVEEMLIATPKAKLRFNVKSPAANILLELENGTSIAIKDNSIIIDSGGTGKVEVTNSGTKINGSALEVS
ncbi:phage baseplate assembly protein V [Hellea sp.]|nr:phage baseplate assembly protein V [Hellea sp.]